MEPIIIKPITLIINQAISSVIFPEKLKFPKLIPLYKKDEKHFIENYRPISILPSVSQIFEKVMFNQLYSYFDISNYLNKSQYGFRKFHSTEHAVLEISDRICSEFENGNPALAIFLDLLKAYKVKILWYSWLCLDIV